MAITLWILSLPVTATTTLLTTTLYMVLNTSCLSIAEHKAFLEETIQANPDVTWKVVSFHKSIYSVASHVTESDIVTLRNGLSPILSQLGIDIVLQGHDHVYARSYIMGGESGMTADVQKNADGSALTEVTNPDGVQYITMNSASGSKFYKITEEAFEYTAVQNQEKVPNYSVANVTKDAFTVTTYRSTDDSVVDTITIKKSKNGWETVDGKDYWYEDGVKQGTEGRGKEIYDPESDAWYWLDSDANGAKAVSKDVYQESDGGKWVRYDENGKMVKGWNTNENGTYYFDPITGAMAKGDVEIDGVPCSFDKTTGIGLNLAWKQENGKDYWYENGVKQGTTGRGKEIYDPDSDAWYWLDADQGGAKAVSKDVYQESNGGKWVRYDANGHMIKGWDTNDDGTYYFDFVTGAMTKGDATIDGLPCCFDTVTGIGLNCAWKRINGKDYWYEGGKRQGYDPNNAAYRGKEIYDPASNGWYWLDNVQQGAKAVSKDVYQESSGGKWVRYDANGQMIKGWNTNADGTYYFNPITGAMAKGTTTIDGMTYYFDPATGVKR